MWFVVARNKTLAESKGKTDGLSPFVLDTDRDGQTLFWANSAKAR